MSNQRPANKKPASMRDVGSMNVYMFFKEGAQVLEQNGESDAAFIFEQVQDWLQKGNELKTDTKSLHRIFGL